MIWTTMLSMCSLSANVLVGDSFGYGAESLLMIGLDRKSEEVISYVDIKSEGLRDILREVLHDIKAVSLMEDQPSVIETDVPFKENADLSLDRAKCAISFPPRAGKICGNHEQQPGPWICTCEESPFAHRPPQAYIYVDLATS